MPQYIDPMQYLSPYFAPKLQKALGMLPTFLAHKRGKEQMAQRKEEFAVRKPYLETQTDLAREKMAETKRAKQDWLDLQQGGLPGFAKLLPEGMTPETYMTGKRRGIFGPVSLKQPKTLERIEAESGARTKGAVAEKPPKTLDRIQAEATARATGTAQAPTKPPTQMDINKEISRLQTARSKILSQWNDFKATGLANDLVVLLTQGQLQAGQGVPEKIITALEDQFLAHIKEVDTQLTEYYRQIGRTPQTFAPAEKDSVAVTIDKYKGGK